LGSTKCGWLGLPTGDELPWTQAVAAPEEAEVIADSLLKLIGQVLVLLTHDTVDW
jgi:hypothetical protein